MAGPTHHFIIAFRSLGRVEPEESEFMDGDDEPVLCAAVLGPLDAPRKVRIAATLLRFVRECCGDAIEIGVPEALHGAEAWGSSAIEKGWRH